MLNGGGGYVKIDGGNIEIGTSGMAQFKAAMKELTSGGGPSGDGPPLKKIGSLKGCSEKVVDAALTGSAVI